MKNKVQTANKGKTKMVQHMYRNVREPVLVDGNNINSAVAGFTIAANTTTAVSAAFFTPIGVSTPTLTVSGSNVLVSSNFATAVKPRLRWLLSTAQNFGRYRVTRATLIFIGNTGTNITGTVVIVGSRDTADLFQVPQAAYSSGGGVKVFDLASAGNKEQRLNLPVDPSWKKVSYTSSSVATSIPFDGATTNLLVPISSVNDLGFTGYCAQVFGAPSQSTGYSAGSFFIEYDVEFMDPISVALQG
jgi:hypothetical protein